MPKAGEVEYSQTLELNLVDVVPSVAGPKRPQDRIELRQLKAKFTELFHKPINENGYNKPLTELTQRFGATVGVRPREVKHALTGGGSQDSESVPKSKSDSSTADNTS